MKTNWLAATLAIAFIAVAVPNMAEAKRLGNGKSTGMQRDMPARTSPDATPAKPAAPAQATPAPTQGAAAGAAAAAPKRSWMGPIAGLAAGLGIAALMSHLGMGEAFGNFLMMALLGIAAVALVMFLLRRFGPARANGPQPAMAGAGNVGNTLAPWSQPRNERAVERTALNAETAPSTPAAAPGGLNVASPEQASPEQASPDAVSRAFVPAAFDSEGFERTAKMIFIRLQAANDAADFDDLRRFTTPELFASLRLDLQERGAAQQSTDVVKVDAKVLDVSNEADRQIVSVSFRGQMIEEKGAAPTDFSEVWHLVRPHDGSREWAIAGLEQLN
jgi:predicted lipid-binding transport protein (Tim44 family)